MYTNRFQYPSNNLQNIDSQIITTRKKAKYYTHCKELQNDIPLRNRFNYLEDVKNDLNDCVNESDNESDCFMFKTSPHKKKMNYNNRRL